MNKLTRIFLSPFISSETSPKKIVTGQVICSYEELNSIYKIDKFLGRLSNIVGLPVRHFEVLYKTPIRLLCCRLQHIPSCQPGSEALYLSQKLDQILIGMKYRENYIMPIGVAPEEITQKRDLWRYATFFALVLVDLGPALTSYSIKVKNENSTTFLRWNPYGNTAEIGSIVTYKATTGVNDTSSLVMAPLVFPSSSIEWLHQDTEAFNLATSAITRNGDHVIMKIVDHAVGIKKSTDKQAGFIQTETDIQNTVGNLSVRECGNQFLLWLTTNHNENSISGLTISTNDELAFKTPETFKAFATEMGLDWKTVKNGFKKLNIHKVVQQNDIFNVNNSEGNSFRCIVINKGKLNLNEPRVLIPTFLEWLKDGFTKNSIAGTKSKPLSFSANDHLYLVLPNIFDSFAQQFDLEPVAIKMNFLSLNMHIKNNDSDYHEFPIDDNKSLKTIKLPLNQLQALLT